eukprot:NODE_1607_length_2423_cov_4.755226.p1 GENE.NODE_1607_length_2423_cov_4.755226~~NODE_1607_length_2423_cov_4.755226.p1  ORF type:complete len:697 (+),score=216.42 NODE_1607_length_2423_cov_4.755226:242-2092(+)
MDCAFVCQNATAKLGIRLMPSVAAALATGDTPSEFIAFAFAVVLRFLTPVGEQPRLGEMPPVFVGRLDPVTDAAEAVGGGEGAAAAGGDPEGWEYTPGLHVWPARGMYEFRDAGGIVPLLLRPLGGPRACRPELAVSIAGEALQRVEGFPARGTPDHERLVATIGGMLHRLLSGLPALSLLAELRPQQPIYLDASKLEAAVWEEVESAQIVDMHTHIFGPGYGAQMVFGIDAMLTYHYLVYEYLSCASQTSEDFYSLPVSKQAECVWQALFVDASPLSEHCRGVVTTLSALGLHKELAARDLGTIRAWYERQDREMFDEKMLRLAHVRYVVTSHDPFDMQEMSRCFEPPPSLPRYRRALSLDKLLEGDWDAVCDCLSSASEPCTLAGVASLLQRSVEALRPELLTAATPHAFSYEGGREKSAVRLELDLRASAVSAQEVLDNVVLPLCERNGLALSLRMGTRRGICPLLGLAGDGVGPAQLSSLSRLCCAHPRTKFLATVLSRVDQHEATIVAGKFRNLHLWGCWWYCNNPSVVSEVTRLRLEMLGTNFTYQASSARVQDQLIYKWIHARAILAKTLSEKYAELLEAGWGVCYADIRRDVHRLLGGAYEEFMRKPL